MGRVVVSGIGAITPLGLDFKSSWKGIIEGRSGVVEADSAALSRLPWSAVGTVKGFDPGAYHSAKELLRLDPFIHYAVAAAMMAAADAGLAGDGAFPDAAGVIVGSSRGGIGTLERAIQKAGRGGRLSPYLMPATTISMAASMIAQKLGLAGACLGISNACASGANAVGEAYRLIRSGGAQLMLAGGAEAPLCRTCLAGYGSAGALSKRPAPGASSPFDRDRDGFVLAEGAAVLVLEDYEAAKQRSARVYAEIVGYSSASDAYHMTKPLCRGEVRAVRAALDDASLKPEQIDLITAHGTSTPLGDRVEAAAIYEVFGPRSGEVPVSALKSMTGHMLAASGAFEAACTAMALREGIIPPTINLRTNDPACGLCLAPRAERAGLAAALTHSFGFGGVNAALVLKKADLSL